MLYFPTGSFEPVRVKGYMVNSDLSDQIMMYIRNNNSSDYDLTAYEKIKEIASWIETENPDVDCITSNIIDSGRKVWEQIKAESIEEEKRKQELESGLLESVKGKKCPACSGQLRRILFGYPTLEIFEIAEKNPEYLMLGGCCCYGDERDPHFYCPKCKQYLYHNLKKVK